MNGSPAHVARPRIISPQNAVRIAAANQDGRLPALLSDITAVPIPADPVTGKPFGYSVSGEPAELKSGSIPSQGRLEFKLRLAP